MPASSGVVSKAKTSFSCCVDSARSCAAFEVLVPLIESSRAMGSALRADGGAVTARAATSGFASEMSESSMGVLTPLGLSVADARLGLVLRRVCRVVGAGAVLLSLSLAGAAATDNDECHCESSGAC